MASQQKPKIVATLATKQSLPDLRVFLRTLQLWNPTTPPVLYIFGDQAIHALIHSMGYQGEIHSRPSLTGYTNYTRQTMEALPGKYGSLWFQFMAEKINLLRWVLQIDPRATDDGVFFFDSDICFFGPLPAVPSHAAVAVSPHFIRATDEARYGLFNGGFLWVREESALNAWEKACVGARFYEQSALEVFREDAWAGRTYFFPIQNNYGWWRMLQAEADPATQQAAWTMRREASHSGVLVDGAPLLSIHTHWFTTDKATQTFNSFVLQHLARLAKFHPPAKTLVRVLQMAAQAALTPPPPQ